MGEALEKKIVELLTTGRLKYYEDLRSEFPPGVISLLQVPGIGPRTAMRLATELGIRSLEELEGAIIEAVDYYRLLLAELQERVADGVGATDHERFRIYWEGMPIWGRLRAHSELFAGLKACVLASTYCNSWIFSAFDAADPFVSMARAYTELFIVRSDKAKEQYLREMLDFFQIDGIVFHHARTCPNNSNSSYGMPQRLAEETGVPYLVIDGDLNDLRCLSDEQTNTNVEAFIEQLEERK